MTYGNGHHVATRPTEAELEAAKCLACGARVDTARLGDELQPWCHADRVRADDVWRRWIHATNYWTTVVRPPIQPAGPARWYDYPFAVAAVALVDVGEFVEYLLLGWLTRP